MRKRGFVICLYVFLASVAIVIIALGSWMYDLFAKKKDEI